MKELIDRDYEKMLDDEISRQEKIAIENLGAAGRLLASHCPRRKDFGDCYSAYAYGNLIKIVLHKTKVGRHPEPPPEGVAKSEAQQPEDDRAGGRMANNLSRAKSRVFEIATCNEFTHFCTFTIDKNKRDRYDLPGFRKALAMMVRNINRGREEEQKIKYIMIPEKHKNGAYHMHGLFMGLSENDLSPFTLSQRLPVAIRKQLQAGETVYNWERYAAAFGYFTATEIKNRTATAKYCTKYITKELGAAVDKDGGHLFYASQGLKGRLTLCWREPYDHSINEDGWDYENEYCRVKWMDPEKRS